mgnify:CR=1 FL=1
MLFNLSLKNIRKSFKDYAIYDLNIPYRIFNASTGNKKEMDSQFYAATHKLAIHFFD